MSVVCSRCGESIAVDDLNLTTAIARCRPCNHAFDARPQLQGPPAALARPERRPALARPAAIRVLETSPAAPAPGYRGAYVPLGELALERSWLSPRAYFLLAFCFFWDTFLAVWYTRPGLTLGAALGPLVHVGVGVYLTYVAAAQLCNTTTIRATSREISIRHAPLPWPGVKSVPTQDVERLYCESVVTRGKGGSSTTFKVNAVLRDGRELTLLSGLPESDQAAFIERQLEAHLGLSAGPVAGDLEG